MSNPQKRRREQVGDQAANRSEADDRMSDTNKPTPGQAEGERDPAEQSEPNRDEGGSTDRVDNL